MPAWCETVFGTTIDAFVAFVSAETVNGCELDEGAGSSGIVDVTGISDVTDVTETISAAASTPATATDATASAVATAGVSVASVATNATNVAGVADVARPSIDDWHRAMLMPIPETVKYTKAVMRITNEHPPIYSAVAYNDAITTGIALTAVSLDVAERAYTTNTSTAWRDEFWLFVRTLNSMSAAARGYRMPNAPSRAEIRENIDSHRRIAQQTAPQAVTVSGAFDIALQTFAKELGSAKLSSAIAADGSAFTTASWNSMLCPAFEDASTDSNREFLSGFLWPVFSVEIANEVRAAFGGEVDPRVFVHLNQMNGFARVAKHIPSNVMDEIEGYTAKLLKDVKSGAVNIRNLDLEKIGSAVLSKVSASDMSALTANLEGLLPILDNTSFKR